MVKLANDRQNLLHLEEYNLDDSPNIKNTGNNYINE